MLFGISCTPEEEYEAEAPKDQVSEKLSKLAKSGRYVFEDGSLYEGELVMGLPDGFGTIEFVSGDLYEGQFEKGISHGYGTMRYKSDQELEKYSGNWENGKRSGFGTLTMSDQSVMEGHWKNGALLYGEYKIVGGAITYGKWDGGVVEEGKVIHPGGDQFCGKFKEDGTYDFGTLTLTSGVIYFV
ncbi:MAG: hypothetical protein VW907_02210, partial [Opitutae bacterium]